MADFTRYFNLKKPASDETYDIADFNANADKIDAAIRSAGHDLPPGATVEYYGENVPEGYLFCEGQAVSREIYAALFAKIGVKYGAGNGATTFNVPDRRGNMSVGYNSSDKDFNALGKTGGSKELQKHDHVIPALSGSTGNNTVVTVNIYAGTGTAGGGIVQYSGSAGGGIYGSTNIHTHPVTTKANNTGEAGNGESQNLPPYCVCSAIIKY